MEGTVLALGAHPDDIEFMMAGTLLRLKDLGYGIHYLALANGNCGSLELGAEELARTRREEARAAAADLGAVHHESLADDFGIFYREDLLRKLTAVVRTAEPDLLLLPALDDYMEDHSATARLGAAAAFARGCPNYRSDPETKAALKDLAVYHALPFGLRDVLGGTPEPHFYVDITQTMERKTRALSRHATQQSWLGESQGNNAYLKSMEDMARELGRRSGRGGCAEGWRRRNPLGYSSSRDDPLRRLLGQGDGE